MSYQGTSSKNNEITEEDAMASSSTTKGRNTNFEGDQSHYPRRSNDSLRKDRPIYQQQFQQGQTISAPIQYSTQSLRKSTPQDANHNMNTGDQTQYPRRSKASPRQDRPTYQKQFQQGQTISTPIQYSTQSQQLSIPQDPNHYMNAGDQSQYPRQSNASLRKDRPINQQQFQQGQTFSAPIQYSTQSQRKSTPQDPNHNMNRGDQTQYPRRSKASLRQDRPIYQQQLQLGQTISTPIQYSTQSQQQSITQHPNHYMNAGDQSQYPRRSNASLRKDRSIYQQQFEQGQTFSAPIQHSRKSQRKSTPEDPNLYMNTGDQTRYPRRSKAGLRQNRPIYQQQVQQGQTILTPIPHSTQSQQQSTPQDPNHYMNAGTASNNNSDIEEGINLTSNNNDVSEDDRAKKRLFNAIKVGNWVKAREIVNTKEVTWTSKLDEYGNTALHFAVREYKDNEVVRDILLMEINSELLVTTVTNKGENPTHIAATFGKTEALKMMLVSNPKCLFTPDNTGALAIHFSLVIPMIETFLYLLKQMKRYKVEYDIFLRSMHGLLLLRQVIDIGLIDVAYELINDYPSLATMEAEDGLTTLECIIRKPELFYSGTSYSFFSRFVYHIVPIESNSFHSTDTADEENSFRSMDTADVENSFRSTDTADVENSFRSTDTADVENSFRSTDMADLENSFRSMDTADVENSFRSTDTADMENQEPPKKDKFVTNHTRRCLHCVISRICSKLWETTLLHVPYIKHLKDDKVKHNTTIELLWRICEEADRTHTSNDIKRLYSSPFCLAVENNTAEAIDVMTTYFGTLIFSKKDGHNTYQLTVLNRSEKVYNYMLHFLRFAKSHLLVSQDNYGNNILHLAGRLAPIHKLNVASGAALQMQRELQWFEEVKRVVGIERTRALNDKKETPMMVFRKEHMDLRKDGEEWMKKTADSYTITAALIITIVFAAAITVPGGNDSATGKPVYETKASLIIFAISDAISLFTATTSLLLFLSILTARYADEDFLYKLPKRLIFGLVMLFVSLTSMMIAFSAALYIMFGQGKAWILIPIAALTCLPIASFVTLQFPLLVELISSTYFHEFLGKEKDYRQSIANAYKKKRT